MSERGCPERCDDDRCGRQCSERGDHEWHSVACCDCGIGWQALDAAAMAEVLSLIPDVHVRDQAEAAWRDRA